MGKQHRIMVALLAASAVFVSGCVTQSFRQTMPAATVTAATWPQVHVVSPQGHDYYEHLFRSSGRFAEVVRGYSDQGMEVRVQRSSAPVNQGLAILSIIVSGSTVFLLPAVISSDESLLIALYLDGKRVKTYEYTNRMTTVLWAFNPPQESGQDAARRMDADLLQQFYRDVEADGLLQHSAQKAASIAVQ